MVEVVFSRSRAFSFTSLWVVLVVLILHACGGERCEQDVPDEPCGPLINQNNYQCNWCGMVFWCIEPSDDVWVWRAVDTLDCDCIDEFGHFDEDRPRCEYDEVTPG